MTANLQITSVSKLTVTVTSDKSEQIGVAISLPNIHIYFFLEKIAALI